MYYRQREHQDDSLTCIICMRELSRWQPRASAMEGISVANCCVKPLWLMAGPIGHRLGCCLVKGWNMLWYKKTARHPDDIHVLSMPLKKISPPLPFEESPMVPDIHGRTKQGIRGDFACRRHGFYRGSFMGISSGQVLCLNPWARTHYTGDRGCSVFPRVM